MNSFHLPPGQWREPFVLGGSEAHHLLKVVRARPGDQLRLFDGYGREGIFIIDSHDRNKAYLTPVDIRTLPRPKPEVHLALGWNKSSRRDWILEKAVELGAAGLVFWQASRSQGRVPETPKSTWHERCVAAAKQCGNPWLPNLETVPGGPRDVIAKNADSAQRCVLWEDQDPAHMLEPRQMMQAERILMVLGPEGGLTHDEIILFKEAGFALLSLGRNVLRWETAALLCLGLLYWQGEIRRT